MTPGSFDPATAREVLGDARARAIEARARTDADAGTFNPPRSPALGTYWAVAQADFESVIYRAQYETRRQRTLRKARAAQIAGMGPKPDVSDPQKLAAYLQAHPEVAAQPFNPEESASGAGDDHDSRY